MKTIFESVYKWYTSKNLKQQYFRECLGQPLYDIYVHHAHSQQARTSYSVIKERIDFNAVDEFQRIRA